MPRALETGLIFVFFIVVFPLLLASFFYGAWGAVTVLFYDGPLDFLSWLFIPREIGPYPTDFESICQSFGLMHTPPAFVHIALLPLCLILLRRRSRRRAHGKAPD